MYFDYGFAEDYQDGTVFDNDILYAFKALEDKYTNKYRVINSNDFHLGDISWDNDFYQDKFSNYDEAVKFAESKVQESKLSQYVQVFDDNCVGSYPKTITRVVPEINTKVIKMRD